MPLGLSVDAGVALLYVQIKGVAVDSAVMLVRVLSFFCLDSFAGAQRELSRTDTSGLLGNVYMYIT